MIHKMLRPFIVKVSVLGYFPLHYFIALIFSCNLLLMNQIDILFKLLFILLWFALFIGIDV